MSTVRLLLLRHARLIGVLMLMTLGMKLLVPSGFMPMLVDGRITIQICPGSVPAKPTATMPGMAMSDHGNGHDEAPNPHEDPEMPCAFAGLAAPFTGAIDPVVLAIAIALILTLALRQARQAPTWRVPHLRPPTRAPPSLA